MLRVASPSLVVQNAELQMVLTRYGTVIRATDEVHQNKTNQLSLDERPFSKT